jgi:radical SAM protein with 4Fe4S-binding SPASM domain
LKRFILSLDGFTKETFEKIRVGGKRDKIYAAVEELLRRKEELGLMYPVIQCQFSVMEENETEVEQFKEFWMARKAEIKIRQKLTWTSTGTIKARELNLGNEFRIPCPWGVNSTAIHQDGNLVACPVDYEGRFIAGNVEKLSIKEIWQTSHRAGLRERHLRHDWENVPEVCKGCPDWQVVGAKYVSEEDKQALDWSRPFWHHDQ